MMGQRLWISAMKRCRYTGKKMLDGLPGSYGSAGEVQQLCVTMSESQYDLETV